MVFVGYGPLPIDLAQADRQAKVQGLVLFVGARSSALHRRDDKSDIPAGSDIHVSNIEGDRIV
jgi:hypothetical protein